MFNSTVIDVAIGLIAIYLLLSLFCSAVSEGIAGIFSFRSRMMAKSIQRLLNDDKGVGLAKEFYSHALIDGLSKKSQDPEKPLQPQICPSFIPSNTFATILLDNIGLLSPANPQTASDQRVTLQLDILGKAAGLSPKLKEALSTLIKQSNGDLAKLQRNIETWFDHVMDRVSNWYKRRNQLILFIIGLVVTLVMNVDTLYIAQTLASSSSMRAAMVADAQKLSGPNLPEKSVNDIFAELQKSTFPVGWKKSDPPDSTRDRSTMSEQFKNYGWTPILGWLFTATAVSFGAQFWFDLLNKLLRIRSTVVKPDEKKQE